MVSESIFFRVLELGGWWENSLTIMEAADQNLQLCVFPTLACFILLWLIAFLCGVYGQAGLAADPLM